MALAMIGQHDSGLKLEETQFLPLEKLLITDCMYGLFPLLRKPLEILLWKRVRLLRNSQYFSCGIPACDSHKKYFDCLTLL